MKRIYLHAGMHKTGTTSFQQNMRAASARLAAEGVFFPPIGERYGSRLGGLHAIPAKFRGKPLKENTKSLESYLEDFEASGLETGLMSSEGFSLLTPDMFGPLTKALEGYEVIPIIVFRHPMKAAVSLYCSAGAYKNKRRAAPKIRTLLNSWQFRYADIAKLWSEAYPRTNFICYEDHGDIGAEIASRISVSYDADASERLRQSLPLPLAELNSDLYGSTDQDDETYYRETYLRLFEFAGDRSYLELTNGRKFLPFSPSEQEETLGNITDQLTPLRDFVSFDTSKFHIPVDGELLSDRERKDILAAYREFSA